MLAIGWVTPRPEAELLPWAARAAVPLLLLALLVALWPVRHIRRATDLDTRLGFGDRLSTAWVYRDSDRSIAALQRSDAIARLQTRSPGSEVGWRPSRVELAAVTATVLVAAILLLVPSPQQKVLDRQAAEQVAVQQATQRLDVLRQEAAASPSLTPEEARQLVDLLQRAQAELAGVRTQREASAILARTTEQLNQQLGDPNADLRDEALSAMSETLAAEPLTRGLGDALQRENASAASDAVQSLAARAAGDPGTDKLSDVERQSLSRALQRASNVGRSDPRSADALRDASRAVGAGEASDKAMSAAETALRESIQASTAQASLRETTQRLRDLQAQLASGSSLGDALSQLPGVGAQGDPTGASAAAGTPVAVDAGGGGLNASSSSRGSGAGIGAAGLQAAGQAPAVGPAAENVFVPGRLGNGPADQDLTDQPFTVRGAPRPYRDVLSQYAQSGRDYVDRPDVSPAVRELVKQYFQQLEEAR